MEVDGSGNNFQGGTPQILSLDANIDNVKLTMPEPGTVLGLLAFGGLGLGLKRKKQG
jgi:hypothetical protein